MSMTHWKANTVLSPQYEAHFKNILDYAKAKDKVVTIFDLETTTFLGMRGFGITEIGMVHVTPKGHIGVSGSLLNPEARIPAKVQELTGITNSMVESLSNFGEIWAEALSYIVNNHIIIGFNSKSFDLKALAHEYKKYTSNELIANDHIDLRDIIISITSSNKGKLAEQAQAFGINIDDFKGHRATNDALLTAKILDRIIEQYPDFESLKPLVKNKKDPKKTVSPVESTKTSLKSLISETIISKFSERTEYNADILNAVALEVQKTYSDKTVEQLTTSISFQLGHMIDHGELSILKPDDLQKRSFLESDTFKRLISEAWSTAATKDKLAPALTSINTHSQLSFDYVELRYGLYYNGFKHVKYQSTAQELAP